MFYRPAGILKQQTSGHINLRSSISLAAEHQTNIETYLSLYSIWFIRRLGYCCSTQGMAYSSEQTCIVLCIAGMEARYNCKSDHQQDSCVSQNATTRHSVLTYCARISPKRSVMWYRGSEIMKDDSAAVRIHMPAIPGTIHPCHQI